MGAVVVHEAALLMIERGRGPGQGLWSIPGGRVEWGETMETAVLRELFEETGLRGRDPSHLGFVERVGPDWHFVIHDFAVSLVAPATAEVQAVAADDAAAVRWCPLTEVADQPDIVPGLVDFLRDVGILTRG